MITWMQRHKKWLIITIWISTIAFVGAGFVGWGQYSYGDKAGAVAKVGKVEITMGDLQKSYSNLYNQYSQIFQGNFDEEKAKSFGLQAQALKNLTNQALVTNLASSYDLEISNEELLREIKSQEYFFQDGVFSKEIYKQALSRGNLSVKEYEADIKKELLIRKALQLLRIETTPNELKIMDVVAGIADKIEYKVLNKNDVTVDTSAEKLKAFWETQKNNYMSEVSYDVNYIKQDKVTKDYNEAELTSHYSENKTHFKDSEGKILPFESAKSLVIDELNAKETKKEALRTYIAFKKEKLENTNVKYETISFSKNAFSPEALNKVSKLTIQNPYLKPVLVNGEFITFKLINVNPSKTKEYQEVKDENFNNYVTQQRAIQTEELAKQSVSSFKGNVTDFITVKDTSKLTKLEENQAKEFLAQLFESQDKRAYIRLSNGDIVMYNILEQKLLSMTNTNQDNPIVRLKSAMFNEGLIKNLQSKYKTEIFIQGL
ncbi:SurA N-terminal domain-containing protein [Sulfurimonas sp.]|nr:SurA N-terminal domain-containing protein [Sulfurimonas sp.]